MTLTSGTLVFSPTTATKTLTITGNISRISGSLDASNTNAQIIFNGTSAQSIPSGSITNNINKLQIGSSTASTVTINQVVTVASTFTVSSGAILNVANAVTSTASITISGTLNISNGITLTSNGVITVNGTLSVGSSVLSATASNGGSTSGTLVTTGLVINTGSVVNNYGYIKNNSSLTQTATPLGSFTPQAYSVYEAAAASPAMPTATWDATTTIYLTGIVGSGPSNIAQSFGNVVWNSTGQTGNNIPNNRVIAT